MIDKADHLSEASVIIGAHRLEGHLTLPADAMGVVIFAHGSGSSRFSPRNRYVAEELAKRGFATLLFDLLTADEAEDRGNVFDIPLLAGRVVEAIDAVGANRQRKHARECDHLARRHCLSESGWLVVVPANV